MQTNVNTLLRLRVKVNLLRYLTNQSAADLSEQQKKTLTSLTEDRDIKDWLHDLANKTPTSCHAHS